VEACTIQISRSERLPLLENTETQPCLAVLIPFKAEQKLNFKKPRKDNGNFSAKSGLDKGCLGKPENLARLLVLSELCREEE